MKSGNKTDAKFSFKFKSKNYEGMHKDRGCTGKWSLTFTMGSRYTIDALGPIAVPIIPLVTCHDCKTSYEIPQFRDFIEGIITKHLVESDGVLTKKQIRFLRLHFGLSQEEFAKNIGVSDRHDMAKIESEGSNRNLDIDRQVRLKLFGAKMIGIKDVTTVLNLNEIDEAQITQIPAKIFPKNQNELLKSLG